MSLPRRLLSPAAIPPGGARSSLAMETGSPAGARRTVFGPPPSPSAMSGADAAADAGMARLRAPGR